MVTNGASVLSSVIAEAMNTYPVVQPRDDGEHAVDCALAPFTGCTAKVIPDRYVAILKDGTPIGTCPNWQKHTSFVRQAGTGSEAQRVFSWIVGTFQATNPNRARGDQAPNKVLDLRGEQPKVVDMALHHPSFNGEGKVVAFKKA